MPVKLLFDFAVICFSGNCQGVCFAARPEGTACKIEIPVMLRAGSHHMDPDFRILDWDFAGVFRER